MKPRCERCGEALSAADDAWICSFECTWCGACAEALSRRCPNCSGELVPRPRRADGAPAAPPPQRVVVAALLRSAAGEYLLCKMPASRGVFPGQWGLPGGGVEPGETIEEALRREVREEVGLELAEIRPLFFNERLAEKLYPDGSRRKLHMIFLVFEARVRPGTLLLNPEFEAADWVATERLGSYDVNVETRDTFARLGL